jgi:hypothetical protein
MLNTISSIILGLYTFQPPAVPHQVPWTYPPLEEKFLNFAAGGGCPAVTKAFKLRDATGMRDLVDDGDDDEEQAAIESCWLSFLPRA